MFGRKKERKKEEEEKESGLLSFHFFYIRQMSNLPSY